MTLTSVDGNIDFGSQEKDGFIVDNVLHSDTQGDIHFSSYIPESYDGSEPYALFVTLPGWEGLYFQGVGANLGESYPSLVVCQNLSLLLQPFHP